MTNTPGNNNPSDNKSGALVGIGVICALAGGLVGYWLAPKSDTVATNDRPAVTTDNGTATQPIERTEPGLDQGDEVAVYEVTPESTLDDRRPAEQSAGDATNPTISDVTTLFGESSNQFVGRSVELRSVPVQGMAGSNSFWVGPSFQQKMLVVADATTMPSLSQADRIHIVGTLTNAPEQSEMMNRWGLDEENVKELTRTNIYLDAREVQLDQR